MSSFVVSFEGWGVSNLEDIIEEIAQSPTHLDQQDIREELDLFTIAFFDTSVHPADQNIKYIFLEACVSNPETINNGQRSNLETGISIYISRKLAMTLQINYDTVIDQIVAAIEDYIDFSTHLSLKTNADIRDFVKKHYSELYTNTSLY